MSYRSDLDALSARADALEVEVAAKTRERDAVKQMLDEVRPMRPVAAPVGRGRKVLDRLTVIVLGVLVILGARVIAHDWPLAPPAPHHVVLVPPAPPPHTFARPPVAVPVPAGKSLPLECEHYRQAIEQIQNCDAISIEARGALRQAFDQAVAGMAAWQDLPDDAIAGISSACQAGAEAITNAMRAQCPR